MKQARYALLLLVSACGLANAASPGRIDPSLVLPPPPAAGSPQAQDEVGELHAIAGRATPDMLVAAKRDSDDERPDLFNGVLGFDVTALPATSKLLNDVVKEQSADAGAAKKFFHRDRPWIVDSSIKSCEAHDRGLPKIRIPADMPRWHLHRRGVGGADTGQGAGRPGACPRICRKQAGLRHAFPQRHHGRTGSGHHRGGDIDAGPCLCRRDERGAG